MKKIRVKEALSVFIGLSIVLVFIIGPAYILWNNFPHIRTYVDVGLLIVLPMYGYLAYIRIRYGKKKVYFNKPFPQEEDEFGRWFEDEYFNKDPHKEEN